MTHLNVIRDILSRVACPAKDEHLCLPDPDIVHGYKHSLLKNGWITP